MQITPAQNQGTLVEPPAAQALPINSESVSTPLHVSSPVAITARAVDTSPAQSIQRQTDVTLHQDANGRAYYLISNARSGQEIIEVPPEAVRAVGQGIQEYLKQEASRSTAHVDTKA